MGQSSYDGCMKPHEKLIKELKKRGYTVTVSRAGHYKVLRPNGSYAMTMSRSPGNTTANNAARRLARRLGLLEK